VISALYCRGILHLPKDGPKEVVAGFNRFVQGDENGKRWLAFKGGKELLGESLTCHTVRRAKHDH